MPYFASQSRTEWKVSVLFHAMQQCMTRPGGQKHLRNLPGERTRQHEEAEQPADVIVSFADVE